MSQNKTSSDTQHNGSTGVQHPPEPDQCPGCGGETERKMFRTGMAGDPGRDLHVCRCCGQRNCACD